MIMVLNSFFFLTSVHGLIEPCSLNEQSNRFGVMSQWWWWWWL